MPFVLLVIGLMGGGLVTLLLLNTILAQGSFALDTMQKHNALLTHRAQALEQDIAGAESPARLADRARDLGMVPVGRAGFVDVKSGKVYGHPVPGVAPPRPAADSAEAARDSADTARRGQHRAGHPVSHGDARENRGGGHRDPPDQDHIQGGPSRGGGPAGHEGGHR